MHRALKSAIALGLLFVYLPAQAAEIRVDQENRQFSPNSVTAKVGDTLVFRNVDTYTHNVYSETKGFEFNLESQEPQVDLAHPLKKAGEMEIRCAIHPKMKLKVKVE